MATPTNSPSPTTVARDRVATIRVPITLRTNWVRYSCARLLQGALAAIPRAEFGRRNDRRSPGDLVTPPDGYGASGSGSSKPNEDFVLVVDVLVATPTPQTRHSGSPNAARRNHQWRQLDCP